MEFLLVTIRNANHVSCLLKFYFSLFMSLYLAWEPNRQYVYKVEGRALTALHQLADQYTGILVKAELAIEPRTHQELRGKVWKLEICSQMILELNTNHDDTMNITIRYTRLD
jgi:hypothetical protein